MPYMGVIPNPKMAFIFQISCILVLRPKKKLDSQAPLHCPQSPRITNFFKPKTEKFGIKENSLFRFVQYLIFLIHLPDLLKIE